MKRVLPLMLTALLCLYAAPAAAWGPPNYIAEDALPEELRLALEGADFVQALFEEKIWYVLTENGDGYRTLEIFKAENGGYAVLAQSAPLPERNGDKPTIHAGIDSVTILYSEALLYGFAPDDGGVWRLTYVQGEHTYKCTRYWLIEQNVWQGRLLYATDTNVELARFDPLLYPPDLDSAAETLDIGGHALVNNPNPADRLHLRAGPGRSAESKGKYYNGTPVLIEEDLGEWARVSVAGVEGYMMKKYLAEGPDMLSVTSAFAELFIKSELYGVELNVYLLPDSGSGVAGILYDRGAGRVEVTVIGIVGDGWVHVICGNGLAGYMPASNFYPGNG